MFLFFTAPELIFHFPPLPMTRDRDRPGTETETAVTLQATTSLVPDVSPGTGMMVKEEPLEDDPLKTEMMVKIEGDPDEPGMVQPSSAATGTGKRNQYTSNACVRRRNHIVFARPFYGVHFNNCLIRNKYLAVNRISYSLNVPS